MKRCIVFLAEWIGPTGAGGLIPLFWCAFRGKTNRSLFHKFRGMARFLRVPCFERWELGFPAAHFIYGGEFMSQIQIKHLTFGYDNSPELIFDDVSFYLDTDWKLGFTGRNGRGKTTFLRLLTGDYEYGGTILSSVEFEYFPYDLSENDGATSEVVMSLCPEAEEWELMRELNFMGVDTEVLYRPFESLSLGERTKVLIAAMFLKRNRFLLIDEPTNHLDTDGRKALSAYLKKKKGYILVSHDRAFLDGCVDHILSVNKSDIEVMRGNFSDWLRHKEMRDRFETEENEKLKKEIYRLEKSSAEKMKWSERSEQSKIGFDPRKVEKDIRRRSYIGSKTKKQMKRAKVIEKRQEEALTEKKKLMLNVETSVPLKMNPLPYHSNRLLSLRDLTLTRGEKTVFTGLSFDVERGDRIAVRGKNGAGKSSLLKLIRGENLTYQGNLERGSRLTISWVPQDTSDLRGSLSAYIENNGMDATQFRTVLRHFGMEREQFEKDLADLSSGQKKKILLTKSICDSAHLYLWDEPLNYMDVISRIQIEEMILAFSPTMIFVEHDAVFTEKVATRELRL